MNYEPDITGLSADAERMRIAADEDIVDLLENEARVAEATPYGALHANPELLRRAAAEIEGLRAALGWGGTDEDVEDLVHRVAEVLTDVPAAKRGSWLAHAEAMVPILRARLAPLLGVKAAEIGRLRRGLGRLDMLADVFDSRAGKIERAGLPDAEVVIPAPVAAEYFRDAAAWMRGVIRKARGLEGATDGDGRGVPAGGAGVPAVAETLVQPEDEDAGGPRRVEALGEDRGPDAR